MSVTVSEVNTTVEVTSEADTVVITTPVTTTVTIVAQGPQGPKGDTGPQGPTGSGMPSEGLTGQVLAKKTDADFDLEWKTFDADEISTTGTTNKFTTSDDISRLANTSGTNTGDQSVFQNIAVSGQSTVSADSTSDTLTLVAGSNIEITTNATTDTVTITSTATGGNAFGKIAVAGQSDVDADGVSDTLNLVGGTNIAITTNSTTDTVTISAVGGGDVVGPASATANNVALFDGTTGKLIKDAGVSISGNNTGDQSVFSAVAVSGQSTVQADTTSDTLTLVAGENIAITTDASADSVTVATVGVVVGPASATDNALTRYDGTTGKLVQNSTATLTDGGALTTTSAAVDFLQHSTTATPPTITPGLSAWNDGEGTLDLGLKGGNVTLHAGEQQFLRVYNDSGVSLSLGQVVYISGAQGNRTAVKLARANTEGGSKDTIGLVAETIAVGAEGWVQVSGTLSKLDTTSYSAGAIIYLSPTTPGAFTTTKPQAPNHLVPLGFVVRIHETVGSVYLKIENGYELDELHDVKITGTPAAGSLLVRDATEGVWENATLTAGAHIAVTTADAAVTVAVSGVGSANGIASLDSGGKVPANQLPSTLMDYRGVWNASTNTPTLADGVGSAGDVYRVTAAGTQNLGSGAISFEIGDYVIFNGTVWEKSDTTDAVASVNGKTGIVTLVTDDISDATSIKKFTTASDISRLANTSGTNTGDQDLSGYVPTSRTVNGQALSGNVTLTTADVADSSNKRYVTDSDLTKLSNTSGTNSGDETQSTIKTKLGAASSSQDGYLTSADWSTFNGKQSALGFTPEDSANKKTTVTGNEASNTFYLTAKAIYDWATGLFVAKNSAITGATKTKITYDNKGLVTAGADATTADIADSTDKRYLTDAQQTVLGNTSGVNSGDQFLFKTVQVWNSFNTAISPSATLPVVADVVDDTLNIFGANNIQFTTDPTTDSIFISTVGRATLLEATTFYVSTSGSDSTGTGSPVAPWRTIQYAVNYVATLDCNAKSVTISVANGTYSELVTLANCVGVATASQLKIVGNSASPGSVIVNGFFGSNIAHQWNIDGFRVGSASTSGIGVSNAVIGWRNITFGLATTHMDLSGAGKIFYNGGSYTIAGNAAAHVNNIGQAFCNLQNAAITISGSLSIGTYFICNYLSLIWNHNSTWTGTGITGKRFSISSCSVLFIGSNDPDTYLAKAGSTSGTASLNAVQF